MQPIWETPPYSAEQIDKLQLLRMVEDYSYERVELWLRCIKADLTAAQVRASSLEPFSGLDLSAGTAGDPRR